MLVIDLTSMLVIDPLTVNYVFNCKFSSESYLLDLKRDEFPFCSGL